MLNPSHDSEQPASKASKVASVIMLGIVSILAVSVLRGTDNHKTFEYQPTTSSYCVYTKAAIDSGDTRGIDWSQYQQQC